jgi:phosphoribosylcarboxyaminoimidazole (NCAIR) mutase
VVEIRFAIRGSSGWTQRVSDWKVTELAGKVRRTLAVGTSVISANRTDTVARTIRVACSAQRTQLMVAVAHSSATITMWLACPTFR